MPQIREVHLRSEGSYIIINQSSLYVNAGDIIRFIADDNYTYVIVIPNKDKFFVSIDGATIELQVTYGHPADTSAVSSYKPTPSTKYYNVERVDIDTSCAPPKIILISTPIP